MRGPGAPRLDDGTPSPDRAQLPVRELCLRSLCSQPPLHHPRKVLLLKAPAVALSRRPPAQGRTPTHPRQLHACIRGQTESNGGLPSSLAEDHRCSRERAPLRTPRSRRALLLSGHRGGSPSPRTRAPTLHAHQARPKTRQCQCTNMPQPQLQLPLWRASTRGSARQIHTAHTVHEREHNIPGCGVRHSRARGGTEACYRCRSRARIQHFKLRQCNCGVRGCHATSA